MQKYKFFIVLPLFMATAAVLVFTTTIHANDESFVYGAGQSALAPAKVQDINTAVNNYLHTKDVAYSYYFQPLDSSTPPGPEIGPGTQTIRSASLLKLLMVLSVYKLVEDNSLSLDHQYTLQQSWLNSNYGQLWQKGPGAKVTLREAIHMALVDSDNTAVNVLTFALEQGGGSEMGAVQATGFRYRQDAQGNVYTTAENYASILGCLYRSCYVNKEDSNTILQLLSETHFPGIVNGLPDRTRVAHKIGETAHTYADCGIVYSRQHPYVLCVMLGTSAANAVPIMSQVSKIVYTGVNS